MDVNDRQVTTESEAGEPRPTSVLVHLSGSRAGVLPPPLRERDQDRHRTRDGPPTAPRYRTSSRASPRDTALSGRHARSGGGASERGLGQRRAGEPVHPGLGGHPGDRPGRRSVTLPCVRRRSRTLQDDDTGFLRLPRLRSELGSGSRGEGSHDPHRPAQAVGDPNGWHVPRWRDDPVDLAGTRHRGAGAPEHAAGAATGRRDDPGWRDSPSCSSGPGRRFPPPRISATSSPNSSPAYRRLGIDWMCWKNGAERRPG